MKVINYKIRIRTIEYEVKTDKGNVFKHKLPKKMTAIRARRLLKEISNEIDSSKE
ncbi:hypothetical protein RCL10_02120 [Staphylococcus lloydii]|uniref:hypothetical protein n=1 Tax=Staphylococcus lloydii TaxID=2781774 RepID=UPI002927A4F9|nr:hypothetical protein [Staphylococcus lloydii]MDU9417313.1 hypothetical protein [Staphylococcus lloydii]